jgi:hypothetical protein
MAHKEEAASHVEFHQGQDVGETNRGHIGGKGSLDETDALGENLEKHALGDEGGWQASVEDAHLANINEHEITVRRAYIFSEHIFPNLDVS